MKPIRWNEEKNKLLMRARGISFEAITAYVEAELVEAVLPHPNPEKYPHQFIFLINHAGYIWCVPFVQEEQGIFLKIAYPSTKYTALYLGGKHGKKDK